MDKESFALIENYMLSCMTDSAHDKEHIYRVLYMALEIARTEENVDTDILICACLLHDIGRREQFENPKLCHAQEGAKKAYEFLMSHGYPEDFAKQVRHCIEAHRYRKKNLPESIEAKILFDADKIDVAGDIGIARALIYKGQVSEPLYTLGPDGGISDGTGDAQPSFFQEYKFKLENIYSRFFTKRGMEIAKKRQTNAISFYNDLLAEVRQSYEGQAILDHIIK